MRRSGVVGLMVACLGLLASGCAGDDCGDSVGIATTLASVDRWVQVTDVGAVPDVDGTSSVSMTVATVTERGQGAPVPAEVRIHSDFTGQVGKALSEGDDAFLGLQRIDGKEMVSFVVTRTPSGEHALPGLTCGQEEQLREQLGAEYDRVLDSLIGVTSERQVKAQLRSYGLG